MNRRAPRVCGDVSRPAAVAHALRKRRQIIVLAELVLSPRVLIVLGAIVALALVGIWRGTDPAHCPPGYRMGTTGPLNYTARRCLDVDGSPRCVPVPGSKPSPAPFSLPSCVQIGGSR